MVQSVARNPKLYEGSLTAPNEITLDVRGDLDNINGQPENAHTGEIIIESGDAEAKFSRNGTDFMVDPRTIKSTDPSFKLDKYDVHKINIKALTNLNYRITVS